MSDQNQVAILTAGAIEGAESLVAAASKLAAVPSLPAGHQLLNQATAYLHGAERLVRTLAAQQTHDSTQS